MSRFVFKMPDLGEGTVEAEVVEWKVKVGDMVQEDQVIAEVMTDKAAVEVPSPVSGRVVSLTGEPGQMIAVGSELIVFDTSGEAPPVAAEFYINVVDNSNDNPRTANLDPVKSGAQARWGYTVFGYVVKGMETVDLIAQYETENNGPGGAPAPIIPVVIESMKRVNP